MMEFVGVIIFVIVFLISLLTCIVGITICKRGCCNEQSDENMRRKKQSNARRHMSGTTRTSHLNNDTVILGLGTGNTGHSNSDWFSGGGGGDSGGGWSGGGDCGGGNSFSGGGGGDCGGSSSFSGGGDCGGGGGGC